MATFSVFFLTLRMLSLFFLSFFHLKACYSFPPIHRILCHDNESSALLQFKESLLINDSACSDSSASPKVASWKPQGESSSGDCCSWDGVECDSNSGHVIGLNLGSSCLDGTIYSNTSLFRLVQLKWLDLSDNALKLQKPGLRNLVESLTNLERLRLAGMSITDTIPQNMANLSSLSYLSLRDCGLHGEFPMEIFQLPNLRILSIRYNTNLTGYLPEFNWSSQLEELWLDGTSFSGQLPDSIGNLERLILFTAKGCKFSGVIPPSLGNLTKLTVLDLSQNNFFGKIPGPSLANLLQITYLSLSENNFDHYTLHWLGGLTKLTDLYLGQTNAYGGIPSSLGNLTQLNTLWIHYNNLTGQIPYWIGNLTQLVELLFSDNHFHGPIPESFSSLRNIVDLNLDNNTLSGTLQFDGLLQLKNLVYLQLGSNDLSLVHHNQNATISLPKFEILGLSNCNLTGGFPSFLRGQNDLAFLTLGHNRIEGHIPKWFLKLGTNTLWYLNLANNLLTGFEQPFDHDVLPWNNLRYLKLHSNMLEGSLPIPPSSIYTYDVSNNFLTGEIPTMFCKLTFILSLALSNNNLHGKLPDCLGIISNSASVIDLRNNSFSGDIPQTFSHGCGLKVIDFSQNKLEGKIPRSLANCTKLEILSLEENKINDTFPSWLGILPQLRVLILRSNGFHGAIGKPKTKTDFPSLEIVDLSNNSLRGTLPVELFRNWTSMKSILQKNWGYMQANVGFQASSKVTSNYYNWRDIYNYRMTMTNKGVMTLYEKIQEALVAIDFSRNRFEGVVPEDIGDLKALRLLNLSNNFLTGPIPPSLQNLKELEALDLSQNKLSGEIPLQLVKLTFLEFFDVSHNFLSGPIPQGNQFDTFGNSSYDANPGLCGKPLSKDCESGEDSPPTPSVVQEDEGSGSPFEFGWEVVVIGYASGFVIGGIIGCMKNTRKYESFVKINVSRWQRNARRKKSGLPRS